MKLTFSGNRRFIIAGLFCLTLFLPTLAAANEKTATKAPPPALVVTAEVETAELEAPITLVGTAEPMHLSEVASEIGGLVEKITARQGARVNKGDTLLQLRNVRQKLLLGEAEARQQEVKTRLEKAEADTRRAEDLFAKKFISEEELNARSTERDSLLRQVEQLQAAIRLIEDRLSRMTVRAPFSGQVVRELTETGEWLGEGDAAVTLADLSTVKVMVPVPEKQIANIKTGSSIAIRFDALPERDFTGKVTAIIPLADADARTFPVQIDVANPDGTILGSMLARATFQIGARTETAFIPKDALVPRPDGSGYVVRVVEGKAEIVPVKVLLGKESQFAVIPLGGELNAGDRVVVRGNERLRPGQAVTETTSDSSKQD
jgi:RND family efflux transporter MFP subunit